MLPYAFLCSAGELPQDVFRKHVAAEFDSFVYQHKQHGFAFLADRRQVLQVDHEVFEHPLWPFSKAVLSSVTSERGAYLQNQPTLPVLSTTEVFTRGLVPD